MTHGFPEFTLGGVLLAPFVPQAAIATTIAVAVQRRSLTHHLDARAAIRPHPLNRPA